MRHQAGRDQRRVAHDGAAWHAVLIDAWIEIEDPLAHADIALDHPVERAAIEHLLAALRHHARDMGQHRLLALAALFGEPLLLPLPQVIDAVAADAELDDMKWHDRVGLARGVEVGEADIIPPRARYASSFLPKPPPPLMRVLGQVPYR